MGSDDSSDGEEGADNWFQEGLCRKSDRETQTFTSGPNWSATSRGWQAAIWDVLLAGSEPGECVLRWPSVIIQAIASMLLLNPELRMCKCFVNLS